MKKTEDHPEPRNKTLGFVLLEVDAKFLWENAVLAIPNLKLDWENPGILLETRALTNILQP